MDPDSPVESLYRERSVEFECQAEDRERGRRRIANLRLLFGVAMLGAVAYAALQYDSWAASIALVLGLVFAWLVRRYRNLTVDHDRAEVLRAINDDGAARVRRDWHALPQRGEFAPPDAHPYANDLDIFGFASIHHLVDVTATSMGESRLRTWLLAPASPAEIAERQPAVAELASDLDWLQTLQYQARLGQTEPGATDRFLDWATAKRTNGRLTTGVWLARASVLALLVVILLSIAGLIDSGLLIVPLVANVAISFAFRDRVGDQIETARDNHDAIRAYASVLSQIEQSRPVAPLLGKLSGKLISAGEPASIAAARLGRLLSYAVPKGSLQHMVLQAATCWDLHLLDRLDAWRDQHGEQVSEWLEVIGWYEALGSLANLKHDNPEWVFPNLAMNHSTVVASRLGHPLIAAKRRVVNDVDIGPEGTFLFVTGSNMSGKSTLLRSIGTNIVLANAGSAVCAGSLSSPPVSLWTSVRIVDSLEHGVSYYMAELLRLKQIVDAALTVPVGDPIVCYLLDEILSGTNTVERQIAARQIISLLLEKKTIGAVSTHDLDLVEAPSLKPRAHSVHFAESIVDVDGQPTMSFDYSLRSGPATSTNALRLMEMVGIPMVQVNLDQIPAPRRSR